VTLLLHCDGSNGGTIFTDSSQYSQTATRIGSAQTSTAQSKFGGASLLLNGTTDYVRFPSSDNFYFSGDFTIEAWVRLSAYPSAYAGSYSSTIISRDDGSSAPSTYGWGLSIGGSSAQTLDLGLTNTSGTRTIISGTANFLLNTWYHVAAVRSGNTVYLYKDGVLLNTGGTSYTSALSNNPTTLKIGALDFDITYKYWFSGNIDEVRITKACRYPSGITFTPSAIAFLNA
jgi:sulfur transfer complex TusBCD TusB component (DsrH family)